MCFLVPYSREFVPLCGSNPAAMLATRDGEAVSERNPLHAPSLFSRGPSHAWAEMISNDHHQDFSCSLYPSPNMPTLIALSHVL